MVAADDGDAVGVANLEGNDEGDGLNAVIPAVDVIAEKQVVGVRGGSSELEHLHHVMELAVDVPHDRHGRADAVHVGLLADQAARALAQLQHFLFGQKLVLHERCHHGVVRGVLLAVETTHRDVFQSAHGRSKRVGAEIDGVNPRAACSSTARMDFESRKGFRRDVVHRSGTGRARGGRHACGA